MKAKCMACGKIFEDGDEVELYGKGIMNKRGEIIGDILENEYCSKLMGDLKKRIKGNKNENKKSDLS